MQTHKHYDTKTVTAETPHIRYAAVIAAGAVRDAQAASVEYSKAEPLDDDHWNDVPDAEIFIGIFESPMAREKAAAFAMTHQDNIILIPLDGPDAEKGV